MKTSTAVFDALWRPWITLSLILVVSLAVLGGLSLRQFGQIRQLQRARLREQSDQMRGQQILVGQLIGLQHDKRQFEDSLVRQLQQSEQTVRQQQQELAQIHAALQQLESQMLQLPAAPAAAAAGARPGDYARLEELSRQIEQSRRQIGSVLQRMNWTEEIVDRYSAGVGLIQGEYIFVDPQTEKPLRYLHTSISAAEPAAESSPGGSIPAAQTAGSIDPVLPVSVNGQGRILSVPFTGTGFLVDTQGHILTNKHVIEPWSITREYRHVLQAGYEGRLALFRVFFAGQAEPFNLQVDASSSSQDVALLTADIGTVRLPVLPCQADPQAVKAGQTVLVLGYPTGFDILLARLDPQQRQEIEDTCHGSLDEMARLLSRRGMIQPLGTRGMCGRVGPDKIVYDAQTAIGASGGPVINPEGMVVAINTALLRSFAGTNFGIPIAAGLELLESHDNPPEPAGNP
ncbi:MAG: trypsin-like peptidase domain-containing protein [Sedimentisphaerales bacterium]|nr:trypsin-like peptidase domain-containing protein [Sedimentisphaerales bacterium]